MTNSLLGLRMLGRAEWPTLRAARLQALVDSPHAFTSDYRREKSWTDARWCQLFDAATWIVATADGESIGIAGLVCGAPQQRYLESLWVAPRHRRHGVLRSMLGHAADEVRPSGVRHLLLWVLEDNLGAQRAYHRLGFVATGKRQPIGRGSSRYEEQMRLTIPQ